MVTVTSRAKTELKRILESGDRRDDRWLRLSAPPVWEGEGDFGIVKDVERNGDHIVSFQGTKVLLMDPGLVAQMPKAVLDFKNSPDGRRFTLDVFEQSTPE